jgi:hypothetical protein
MVATVSVQEYNGAAPGVATVITQGRYCTSDTYNPGLSNPCVVPTSGLNYSYWKTHNIAFSGTFTQISNIRWYTSGSIATTWALGTDGYLAVGIKSTGDNGLPIASYEVAAGTLGTSGTWMDTSSSVGHSYYRTGSSNYAAPADADDYTSASTLLIDSGPYTSAGASKCVVTQVVIDTDATQGDKANETLTYRYDEI